MKRKILFVDDDQDILDGFRAMLHSKRKEWKCRFAINAKAGLELVKQEPFDVIVADMRMPGMDGADFLKEVEKIQPSTARIIISGYSEMQALLKSVKHAHQFLSKPCNSEIIIGAIRRVTELIHILNDDSIRAIVARLDSLPVLPDLYIKITQELESVDPDLNHIAQLVAMDGGMSATIMKTVNSSFFGFYENISSPVRAVILLGIETIKGLILGVQLLKEINMSDLAGYSVAKLWAHCLQTGYFAKTIAALESQDDEFMENCFIGGMLHDVGKLILITQMQTLYNPVIEAVREEGGPIIQFEKSKLGVTHAEIGAYLLGLWGFKKEVVQGVFGHHAPNKCGDGITPALVIHVANVLQHELAHHESKYEFSSIDMDWLTSQGLDTRLEVWRDACEKHLEQT